MTVQVSPEVSPEVSESNPVEVAYRELRAAFAEEPSPEVATRRDWLEALLAMTSEISERVADAASDDFGHRSRHESRLAETWLSASNLRYVLRHFETWVQPKKRRVGLPFWFGTAEVHSQPKGVVGIISPWNYPFMLPVEQLAGALAAGNRVIVKLSEHTPKTSALLAKELEARLPRDVVRVFHGDVAQGVAVSSLPLDHLLFTGGTDIGKKVYEAAARNLVPVTLELGGKSPAILHQTYSIERFAKSVVRGKCFSAGQSCVAPDYLLVPRGMETRVLASVSDRFADAYPTLRNNPDYSSVLGAERRRRLQELVDEAVALGAREVTLNPASESFVGSDKLPLTLLFDVPPSARVLREEIFGPILPIIAYDSIEGAVAYVNERPRPLALYYFDDDERRADGILQSTMSGGSTINDTLLHFLCDDLPRSATGQSGIGAYHARMSFDAFSHQRSVFRQARTNGIDLLSPPYGPRLEWITRWLIGR